MAEVLKVSKSGYYRWRKVCLRTDPEESAMKDLICSIYYEHHGRYGQRRITKEIQKRGLRVNIKRVQRLMRKMNLRAMVTKKRVKTTDSDHKRPVNENLLKQNFRLEKHEQIWLSDITFIRTNEGWLYLCVVMDLYSRRILGWHIAESLDKELLLKAFEMAAKTYEITADAIFHSDQGSQFAAEEFRDMLGKYGFRQSMSGKGNCYDNAPMESFFHTLKRELYLRNIITSKYQTRVMIFEYIEFYYNKKRLHSSLKYRTPDEVFFSN